MDVTQVVLVLSATVLVLVLEKIAMTEPRFDDERLDVDRLAIDDRAIDDASNLRGESDLRTIVSLLSRLIQGKQAMLLMRLSPSPSTAMLSTRKIAKMRPENAGGAGVQLLCEASIICAELISAFPVDLRFSLAQDCLL